MAKTSIKSQAASYGDGCAIQIASAVEDQVGVGLCTVRAGEAMQNGVGPFAFGTGCKLIDHAAGARHCSAIDGCAVQIASFVPDHSSAGAASIRVPLEVIKDGFLPIAIRAKGELEYRAGANVDAGVAATLDGRAVKIP